MDSSTLSSPTTSTAYRMHDNTANSLASELDGGSRAACIMAQHARARRSDQGWRLPRDMQTSALSENTLMRGWGLGYHASRDFDHRVGHCGVRNVMFDEDRSQVRCSNIPHMMAALRNTTIGLLRWAAIPTLRQLVAGWLPSQCKRWLSSVLNSKTEWPCLGREESVWRLCNAASYGSTRIL